MNYQEISSIPLRVAWRWMFPEIAIATVVALAIQFVPSEPPGIQFDRFFGGIAGDVFLPVSFLVFAVLLIRPLALLFDASYRLGTHHLYGTTGRISLQRRHSEIAFEDMRGVKCEQGLLSRLLNIGTVLVWTASANAPAITMRGLSSPEHITHMIRERIDRTHIQKRNHDEG